MNFCSKCGTKIKVNDKFCSVCGVKTNPDIKEEHLNIKDVSKIEGNNPRWIWITNLLIVGLIIGLTFSQLIKHQFFPNTPFLPLLVIVLSLFNLIVFILKFINKYSICTIYPLIIMILFIGVLSIIPPNEGVIMMAEVLLLIYGTYVGFILTKQTKKPKGINNILIVGLFFIVILVPTMFSYSTRMQLFCADGSSVSDISECSCKVSWDGSECSDTNNHLFPHYSVNEKGYPKLICEGNKIMKIGYACQDNKCIETKIYQQDCANGKGITPLPVEKNSPMKGICIEPALNQAECQ